MFSITIEAETASEVRARVIDLARTLSPDSLPVSFEDPPAQVQPPAPPPPPVDKPPAVEPPPPPKKPTRAELEASLRSVLGPLMTSGKKDDVNTLLARFGGKVSAVPEDKLEEAIEAAKELA